MEHSIYCALPRVGQARSLLMETPISCSTFVGNPIFSRWEKETPIFATNLCIYRRLYLVLFFETVHVQVHILTLLLWQFLDFCVS
jgi:hypothetical protein